MGQRPATWPGGQLITGGVDTHKDFHVAVALDDLGRLLGTEQSASSAESVLRMEPIKSK